MTAGTAAGRAAAGAPAPASGGAARRPRVALYSHDAHGLGHIRRNLAIAHALSGADAPPDVLLLTSAPEAAAAGRPPGCDLLSLPAFAKDESGGYAARHLSLDAAELTRLRRGALHAALDAFRPDALVVDKHVRGLRDELEPALDAVRARGCRVVLGLRDVLDEGPAAAREWRAARGAAALARWYDEVWVYGDPAVHDPVADLELPERVRVRHTGYLAHGRALPPAPTSPERPYLLATTGGGQDGAHVARAFAGARMPAGHVGVVLAGPHMPLDAVRELEAAARGRDDLRVLRSAPDAAALVAGAAAVVGMGGYNTVCEALAARVPLLVVPRVSPRREQLVRARALARIGALELLEPGGLAPERLGAWAAQAVRRAPRPAPAVDLDGLLRLPDALAELIGPATDEEEERHVA